MAFKLNAALRLSADTETSSPDGKAISPAKGFREQNEEALKDNQKDTKKLSEDRSTPESTNTEATTETPMVEPSNTAPDTGGGPSPAGGDGGSEGGEGEGAAGDTTITMDIPQDNDDDLATIDAVVAAAVKRLQADKEVDADADPKLFNMANQPMGPMA